MAETSIAVCSLFERDYHHGVAALINSLTKAGYCGEIYLGTRDPIPRWLERSLFRRVGRERYCYGEISLNFIRLETEWHFTNYKPIFIDYLFDTYRSVRRIYYFDPDIFVRASWIFFTRWGDRGIALCEDVNSPLSRSHPKRYDWKDMFPELELGDRMGNAYINAGFIGISREYRTLLEVWRRVIVKAQTVVGGVDKWYTTSKLNAESPFSAFDQDALNIALMCCPYPMSIIGREGMDFQPGGYVMSHAVGSAKPWRNRFALRALRGLGLSPSDRAYVANIAGPVASRNLAARAAIKVDFNLARIIKALV